MSWNQYLYQYHKKYGGQFLAGEIDDGLLVLPFKDRPLVVTLSHADDGRGRSVHYVQARIPVTLAKPYRLTVGAEKKLSGGVNTVLRAVPAFPRSPKSGTSARTTTTSPSWGWAAWTSAMPCWPARENGWRSAPALERMGCT